MSTATPVRVVSLSRSRQFCWRLWHFAPALGLEDGFPAGHRGHVREFAGTASRFRQVAEVDQDIAQLLAGELRPHHALLREGLPHGGGMVPHVLGQHNGVSQRSPLGHRPGFRKIGRGDTVALGAVPGCEQGLTAAGISGLVEEPGRIEVGEQVRRRFRTERGFHDALLAHGSPHGRGMVPHGTRQQRGREVSVHQFAQIGRNCRSLAIDTVALDTSFGLEQMLSAPRITRRNRGRARYRGGKNRQAKTIVAHHNPPS